MHVHAPVYNNHQIEPRMFTCTQQAEWVAWWGLAAECPVLYVYVIPVYDIYPFEHKYDILI
jgi:hypothetical protein